MERQCKSSVGLCLVALGLIMFLSACSTGADARYSKADTVLVWKATVPFAPAGIRCTDTGEAELSSVPFDKGVEYLPAEMRLDHAGRAIAESASIDVAKHGQRQVILRDAPTRYGYVAIDDNWVECWYEKPYRPTMVNPPLPPGHTETISIKEQIGLDSVIKMLGSKGDIVWETPGLADASVFHIDDSIIALSGKDSMIVKSNPRGPLNSQEYGDLIRGLYDDSVTFVWLLDTSNGVPVRKLTLPPEMRPKTLIGNDALSDLPVILAEEWNGYGDITGYGLYNSSSGESIVRVNLTETLPGVIVKALEPTETGLVASGADGTVSSLSFEGRKLWTETPKRSSKTGMSIPELLCSNAEGQVMVRYSQGLEGSSSYNVAVFDAKGACLFDHANYNDLRVAQSSPFAITIAWGPNWDDKGLWRLEMDGGDFSASQLQIDTPVHGWAISPSGEYILIVTERGESSSTIAMFRVTGGS